MDQIYDDTCRRCKKYYDNCRKYFRELIWRIKMGSSVRWLGFCSGYLGSSLPDTKCALFDVNTLRTLSNKTVMRVT